MSLYRDSRYNRTDLRRNHQFLGSGHSVEDLRFAGLDTDSKRTNRGYSGRSLDRLQDEERQPTEYPIKEAPFRSRQHVSQSSSINVDGRNSRHAPPSTQKVGITHPGYLSNERYLEQNRSRGNPPGSRPGFLVDDRNPRQSFLRPTSTIPQQQPSPDPTYFLNGQGPRPFDVRGVPPTSRQKTPIDPRQSVIMQRQQTYGPRQQAPLEARPYLSNRVPHPPIQTKPPPPPGYAPQINARNPSQFDAIQHHSNLQPQVFPNPRPPLNQFVSGPIRPMQNSPRPQLEGGLRHTVPDTRFLGNNPGNPVYNGAGNLVNVPQQDMKTRPSFQTEIRTLAGPTIVHPAPASDHIIPGPHVNPHNVQPGFNQQNTYLPQQVHPNDDNNQSGNMILGAPIISNANGMNDGITHMTTNFQPVGGGGYFPLESSQNFVGNPTMQGDNNLTPQIQFSETNPPMRQANMQTDIGEVTGVQPASTSVGTDGVGYDPSTTNQQNRGASIMNSNVEELISQLPSRNNRIISVQGILHHQQHQEQQRRRLSRQHLSSVVDDGSHGGHILEQEEAEDLTPEEAQEELQRLREEAQSLAQRRLRRHKLQHIIQKEASSATKDFVASISSVAHTSENVLTGAVDRINFVNMVKKKMEAEAGASVAAVFDLCSDLLRLNLFLAVILLSTIVIPSLVWTDDSVSLYRQTDSYSKAPQRLTDSYSRALHSQTDRHSREASISCSNFSRNFVTYQRVEDYDQVWGWITQNSDGIDDVLDSYSNDTTFVCSGAALSSENLQVAVCSAYYVLQQECYSEERDSFIDFVLDFLQGKGFLERTSIFIGWYPALLTNSADSYVIHLAYPLSIMLAYGVSIWYVVRGFARWLKTQREILDFTHLYNNMIFRGWDCNIANEKTATTEKKLLATEIQAAQYEEKFLDTKQSRTVKEERILLLTRIVIHIVVLVLIFAGWTAIYYVVVRTKGDSFWEEYAATMTIGALNFVLPLIFFGLSRLEQYRSKDELLLFIIRNIFVRLISIIILAVSEISSTIRSEEDTKVCNAEAALCWETKLAQQIYSLIIFDTLLYFPLALVVVIRNLLRKVPNDATYIQWIPKPIWTFMSNPEFDTAGQVLRIVHVQTLCWMGLVCAPMIPLITSISFIIMILLNGATIFFCDLRPLTVFRASRSSSTFTGAILIGLVLSMIPSALVFTWLRPSLGCSPFRGLDYAYHALVFEMCQTPMWIQNVLFYLDNFVVMGLVLLVLLLALIFFVAKGQAAAAQVKRCEDRLKTMARDKRRLVNFTKILYSN